MSDKPTTITLKRRDGSEIGTYPCSTISEAVVNALLNGTDLSGADLSRANLLGANLSRADLSGADLSRADLSRANLLGAKLSGANLDDGSKLVGERPVLIVGPVGSVSRYVTAYLTDRGLRIRAGCFFGTEEEFIAAVRETHRTNQHSREYRAVLDLMKAHEALWAPEVKA